MGLRRDGFASVTWFKFIKPLTQSAIFFNEIKERLICFYSVLFPGYTL